MISATSHLSAPRPQFGPVYLRGPLLDIFWDANGCAVASVYLSGGQVQTHSSYAPPDCWGSLTGRTQTALGIGSVLLRTANLHDRDSVKLTLHPCQHAVAHLPCTRPPDPYPVSRPARPGPRDHISLTDSARSMPRQGVSRVADDDEAPIAAAAGGRCAGGARRPRTPPALPVDL